MSKEISLAEYNTSFIEWSSFWTPKFKQSIDISDIFTNDEFLSKLNRDLGQREIKLFNDWREINQKSFSSHRETYDQ